MSLWDIYLYDFKFPELKEDKNIDTLIIGGGITGLSCLYYLKEKIISLFSRCKSY